MKLSIVDFTAVQPGEDPSQALHHSIALAQKAETLGYDRYWVAEHHGKAVVGRAPEVLIAAIAAGTSTIRVGSGSVLMNHYSAFKVAEVFSTLNDLYPDRIDLGIGRATTTAIIDRALQQDRSKRFDIDSDDQLDELVNWLQNSFNERDPFSTVPIHTIASRPQLHVSGSGPWSAKAAGQRGLRYVFAGFFNPYSTPQIIEEYRSNFRPSDGIAGIKKPQAMLGLHIVCADTEKEAQRQLAPVQIMYRYLSEGKLQFTLPTPDKAVEMLGGLPDFNYYQKGSGIPPKFVAGTIEQVGNLLTDLSHDLSLEDFIIQDVMTDQAARMRSYELMSTLL